MNAKPQSPATAWLKGALAYRWDAAECIDMVSKGQGPPPQNVCEFRCGLRMIVTRQFALPIGEWVQVSGSFQGRTRVATVAHLLEHLRLVGFNPRLQPQSHQLYRGVLNLVFTKVPGQPWIIEPPALGQVGVN